MTVDRYSLNGKVALVTGAARGIGLAIVEEFVRAGALVYAADINDSLADANLSKLADPVRYVHLDVSCEADWQKVSEQLDRHHGGVDVLVNNAGITGFYECKGPHDPEHLNMASWRKVHAVNLDGVALGCKYAIGLMKGRAGASIVNISSRSGLVGIPAAAAYASSKAGVRNHTKTVALYCAEQGYSIRCNSIHPGAVLTPLWDPMLGEGDQRQKHIDAIAADVPLRTMGQPEDVAAAALYLASDAAKYVTGIELNIDGGILAGASAAPKND